MDGWMDGWIDVKTVIHIEASLDDVDKILDVGLDS